jgi:hypothetical protein
MRPLSILLLATLATSTQAQLPEGKSVWLEWSTLRVAIAPQSVGTFVWIQKSGTSAAQPVMTFSDNVQPTDLTRWVGNARTFATAQLSEADTGTTRSSAILNGRTGGAYVVRRKVNGAWSPERFLIVQNTEGAPIAINMDEAILTEVLDSLNAVGRRTRYSAENFVKDTRESANHLPGVTPPVELADSPGPGYAPADQLGKIEGPVLVSIIIGADGKPDVNSVRVIHSAAPTLLGSVLAVLPDLKFTPASLDGRPVRYRVVLPFTFSLKK